MPTQEQYEQSDAGKVEQKRIMDHFVEMFAPQGVEMKKYPCPLSITGTCEQGGNKHYNYGFASGTSPFCRQLGRWIVDMKECPKPTPDEAKEEKC